MNPIRLELTPEQFAALGGHTPGPRKPLSPLPAGEDAVPEMDTQLIQAGLLDPNRDVKEPFDGLLSALGKAEVMVDLSWTDAGDTKGFTLYSPKTLDGSNPWAPTWAAETALSGVVLRSPFTRQDLETELQLFLGAGEASAPILEVRLTVPQAVVLAALMDGQNPQNAADASLVLETLQRAGAPEKLRRYFSVPVQSLTPALDWTLESVQHVLNSLVRLGLCTQSGEAGYFLSEPMRKILESCAISGKVFWLTLRRSEGESEELPETEAEHIGFCSSGTNLVFSWMNGNFRLKTFSRADIAGMIAKEIFPVVLSPVERPVASAVRIAATPEIKKKIPTGLIAGLVGVLLVACVLLVVGVVLLLV
jgi:hypothetical protein